MCLALNYFLLFCFIEALFDVDRQLLVFGVIFNCFLFLFQTAGLDDLKREVVSMEYSQFHIFSDCSEISYNFKMILFFFLISRFSNLTFHSVFSGGSGIGWK